MFDHDFVIFLDNMETEFWVWYLFVCFLSCVYFYVFIYLFIGKYQLTVMAEQNLKLLDKQSIYYLCLEKTI